MVTVKEGLGAKAGFRVQRNTGSGAIALTTPERRIVDQNFNLITGYDWAAATWDAERSELYFNFDSTLANLTAVGTYWVQLRGVLDGVKRGDQVKVVVEEWGP